MSPDKIAQIRNSIRDVSDFPKKGILFKDLTTAFKDPEILQEISDVLLSFYKDKGITKVIGIEARGFIMGSILAHGLGAGFIPIRKPGKLPSDTYTIKYELEYGTDSIEVHKDALQKDDVVLLHDDLLATGGTANASVELIKKFGVNRIFVSFIVELGFLHGRSVIDPEIDVYSLITY